MQGPLSPLQVLLYKLNVALHNHTYPHNNIWVQVSLPGLRPGLELGALRIFTWTQQGLRPSYPQHFEL